MQSFTVPLRYKVGGASNPRHILRDRIANGG